MGTGLTTFLWYGLCGGVVLLAVVVGIGLFAWGTHREKRRNRSKPPS
mgnify:FL=1|jgi:hypothetical protein